MMTPFDEMPCVRFGNAVLKLELEEPSEDVVEIARKELRETPEVREEAIKKLRALLEGRNRI